MADASRTESENTEKEINSFIHNSVTFKQVKRLSVKDSLAADLIRQKVREKKPSTIPKYW